MVLTVHDITQLKETEKQLTLAKEKAENADLSKSAFLANMSHEIRTPLNAITGFAEVLASANTEEEKAQYQEIIKMNADLLLQLVNDILDMSKIEAGTLEFVYTKVDINLLLSDLRQLFPNESQRRRKNIRIIAEPSLPSCSIETDRNRVAQVLSILPPTPLNSRRRERSASVMRQEIPNFIFMSPTREQESLPTNYRKFSAAS